MLAESDVLAGLRDLAVVFRPPNGRDDLDRLAYVYRRALDDVEAFEFRLAVKDYIAKGQQFWPTPSKLRISIDEHRRRNPRPTSALPLPAQYARWESRSKSGGSPCPVCGARLKSDPADQTSRPQVYHDHQIHYEARVGYTGPRTGPVDARKHLLPVGSVSVTKSIVGTD